MIITSCGNSESIAKKLAKKLKVKYSPLTIAAFPDGDLYLKYNTDLKGKKVVIVQSFQPNPDMSLFDIVFAAETAKDLGAKKVILVAPYLAFMRQDKRFHPGESISSKIMAKLLNNSIDKLITIDPHIHRYKSLKDIFTIPAKYVTANKEIAKYIQKNFKNEIIIGPDEESYQWAKSIANEIHVKGTVFKKTRLSSRHVEVKVKDNIEIKGKNVVIVDDIISTGNTLIKAAKKAKKMGAKKIVAIGVHGLFVENAIEKIKKSKVIDRVITTNTIDNKTSKIDVTEILLNEVKKEVKKDLRRKR